MRRRRFLLGLGVASTGVAPGLTAGSRDPGNGRGNGHSRGPADVPPIENADSGEAYDAIGSAVAAASSGDTLIANLGATFEEGVEIDVEGLTLRAAANGRPRVPPTASVDAIRATGNEAPTLDEDADAAVIEATGRATPTVEGDLDVVDVAELLVEALDLGDVPDAAADDV